MKHDFNQLTPEEQEQLKKLIDKETPQGIRYRWELSYQQQVLGMLLTDRVFLIQSLQLVKPEYFVEWAHEDICRILFDYFVEYTQLPTKQTIRQKLRDKYSNDTKKFSISSAELEHVLKNYYPGVDTREHCTDMIAEFSKEMALRNALSATLDILEKGKKAKDRWTRIEDYFKKALMTDRSFDIGLDYFSTLEERYDRMQSELVSRETFVTGIGTIDNALQGGGLGRGEIGAYTALPGLGKSVLLVKTAVRNVLLGKKVLFLSLEQNQDKIARRFDAQFAQADIRSLGDNRNNVIKSIKELLTGEVDQRKLIIKQFPAGTADMNMVRAYMSQLNLNGFKPDLFVVDYVGEFKDDPNVKTYESRQRLVRDLRGFGVENGHCTFTAMQPGRSARNAQEQGVIDDDMLADSFGQARPLDALWSINQSLMEKDCKVGRIFVVKHRDGESRFTVYFKQNKETLDVQEIDRDTHSNILSMYKQKKSEDTKIMELGDKWKPNKPSK